MTALVLVGGSYQLNLKEGDNLLGVKLKMIIITGFSMYIFLINCPALLAATTDEEVKGGVIEGQAFVDGVTSNPSNPDDQPYENKKQSGGVKIRSISPDEAADQINGFFGSAYGLVAKLSPEGLMIALALLALFSPFISNFLARFILSIVSFLIIQNLPFIIGVFQGLSAKIKI